MSKIHLVSEGYDHFNENFCPSSFIRKKYYIDKIKYKIIKIKLNIKFLNLRTSG